MDEKRQITIVDVAKHANVSPATVGRVLGNYGSVSDKTMQRVQESAKQLGFIPNAFAQSLKKSKMKTLGVILSDIKNAFFARLLDGIEMAAHQYGYAVIVCNTNEDAEIELNLLRMLYNKRVDGILIVSAHHSSKEIQEEDRFLYGGTIPVVYIDREIQGLAQNLISVDNVSGGYDATKYLLSLGHRCQGIIAPPNFITIEQRINGCKKAFREAGIDVSNCKILRIGIKEARDGRAIRNWLYENSNMTAIFTLNNDSLLPLMMQLRQLEKKIPNDFSLVCWDDCELAEYWGITVVEQPTTLMGRLAVERVLSDKNGLSTQPNMTALPTSMTIRESCHSIQK